MEIQPDLAAQALQAALERYPHMCNYQPQLAYRALFQGGAYFVQYDTPPPPGTLDIWEFQNAVVKGYKRLAGLA